MALTDIKKVRIEVGDNDVALPILGNEEYEYFLEKNAGSIPHASLDAAKAILFNLSQRTDETVDILSIKGARAAEQYRLALQLFLKDPFLNPIISNARAWFGGVSLSEMEMNDSIADNNIVRVPSRDDKYDRVVQSDFDNRYGI